MLTELFPWDDPNYGIDEQWAVLYPRTLKAHIGDRVELELRITNHSPVEREFRFTPRLPPGLSLESRDEALKLQPNASGTAKLSLRIENDGGTSRVVTADIHSDEMNFPRWVDALIRVER